MAKLGLRIAIIAFALAASVFFLPAQSPKKIVVWSFTSDVAELIERYKLSPGFDPKKVEIEYLLVPNDVYQSKLDPLLQSGTGAPDVFALEAAYLKKYVESGYLADLGSLKKAYANTVRYVLEAATDEKGRVLALSWQTCSGAYFYRRSIAKTYFGTDDPAAVQALIADGARFRAAAETLKRESGGKAVMIASWGDLFQVYKGGREAAWVVDGKLVIDPAMMALMEQCKVFHDNGYEGRQGQWGEGWFAGMSGSLMDEEGDGIGVLGYFMPMWGLQYVLKPNAKSPDGMLDSSGDWAMVQGPIPYFWGGTWMALRNKNTLDTEALKLVEYICSNEAFLKSWAKEKGDVVSNVKVVEAIKGSFAEPFLGGQNHYALFADIMMRVNADNMSAYDQTIEALWIEQLNAYVEGGKDLAGAIAEFKAAVAYQCPDILVE